MSFTCKYDLNDGGEARFPPGEGVIQHICCDCGLTHLMHYTPCEDGGFTMTFHRDNRSTGQRRRNMQKRSELASILHKVALARQK